MLFTFVSRFHKVRCDLKRVKNEILFLVIKFVLSKIKLAWLEFKIMLFFVAFFNEQGRMFVSLKHWDSTLFRYAISLKLVVGAYRRSHSSVQWKTLPGSSPWTSLKFNFQIVNLCNGGTKDFVALWDIIHLNIWAQLT